MSKSCRSVSEDEDEEARKVVASRRQKRFEALRACPWLRPPPLRRMRDVNDDVNDDDGALAARDETDMLVRVKLGKKRGAHAFFVK